jgi:hypothetical protein
VADDPIETVASPRCNDCERVAGSVNSIPIVIGSTYRDSEARQLWLSQGAVPILNGQHPRVEDHSDYRN